MFNRLLATILVLIILLGIAFSGGTFLYKKQLKSTVALIIPDLANDLINQANFSAEKRISLLRSLGFVGLALSVDDNIGSVDRSSFCWTQSDFPIVVDGLRIGSVLDCSSVRTIISFSLSSPFLTGGFIGILFLVFLAYFLPLVRYKLKVREFIKRSKDGNLLDFAQENSKDEVIGEIFEIIQKLSSTKLELERVNLEKEKQQLLGLLARQVAHDIRSPLSALTMVASDLKEIPEEKRQLVRSAVQRINDIATDLLSKSKKYIGENDSSDTNIVSSTISEKASTILLPALMDTLIAEKRLQYRNYKNIEIESDFKGSFDAFVWAEGKELMRLFSNLINNSIEACQDNGGKVVVSIRTYGELIQVSVCDDGCGISEEILLQLGKLGTTYGKDGSQSGSGLGVYHAKRYVEEIGGRITFLSRVGQGTLINITLQKSPPPSWFLSSIEISLGMTVITLDDDATIHSVWAERLKDFRNQNYGVTHHSFTSAIEFKKHVISLPNNDSIYFLIDYELIDQDTDGLSVISDLDLRSNVALVTSQYDVRDIQKKCDNLGIKLLPKALAGFVPIIKSAT